MTTPVADFTGDNASLPFIVFASSEGAWGNALVVQYANFDDVLNEFDIVVYMKSIPEGQTSATLTLLETWRVSRSHKQDGFGKQMYLMDKINGNSDYIWVEDNTGVSELTNFDHLASGEALFTGDNTTVSFSGNLSEADTFLIGKNVQRNSIGIDIDDDGEAEIVDNGQGKLIGSGVTGTIDYGTGAYSLTFEVAPAATVNAVAGYAYSSSRQMSTGSDGGAPTLTDVIEALAPFEDRETLPIRILIQPGITDFNEADYVALQKEIQRICEVRTDCFGILSAPSDKRTIEDLYMWMRQVQQIDSSYVATYGPDLKIRDSYNDTILEVPPSGFVAGAYAETDNRFGPHMPPAGTDTGLLNVLGTAVTFNESQYDLVYPENLNLIMNFNATGPVIWGARTGLKRDSHFRDINIRRLLIQIRASARQFLLNYHFKLNTDFTRLQVTERLTSYLETVKGLSDFVVVCNSTNNTAAIIDANELRVDLYLKPEVMIEFIRLQSIVTDSGVSFEELVATGGNFT